MPLRLKRTIFLALIFAKSWRPTRICPLSFTKYGSWKYYRRLLRSCSQMWYSLEFFEERMWSRNTLLIGAHHMITLSFFILRLKWPHTICSLKLRMWRLLQQKVVSTCLFVPIQRYLRMCNLRTWLLKKRKKRRFCLASVDLMGLILAFGMMLIRKLLWLYDGSIVQWGRWGWA